MAMFDSNIDYTKFIQFNGGTLRVATFVEIRDALVKRYKEIYGNDIDVSSASADGQYINEIALIINNIVNTFQYAFDQLDPSVATGKYLDILCSYNNVQRINQTASEAEIYIYNSSPEGSLPIKPEFLLFTDRGGQIWRWTNPINADGERLISFPAGEATLIENVICEELGSIEAQGSRFIKTNGQETDNIEENDWNKECPGWIYQLVDISPLRVWQYKNAVVGDDEETDESLRSRRYQLLGNQSVSVLEGLHGSLLNISGIDDVFIINNSQSTNMDLSDPVNDETKVLGHSIYIALRYKEGVNIDDSMLAKLIYNKLTPGISTTPYTYNGSTWDDTESGFKSYRIQRTSQIFYTIYWKQCQAISPKIVIRLNCNSNYDFPDTLTSHEASTLIEKSIVENLQEYISDIDIDAYLQIAGLLNVVQQSDRQKEGVSTFFVKSGSIDPEGDNLQNYPANLSYFKYADSDYKFEYSKSDPSLTYNDICEITIG